MESLFAKEKRVYEKSHCFACNAAIPYRDNLWSYSTDGYMWSPSCHCVSERLLLCTDCHYRVVEFLDTVGPSYNWRAALTTATMDFIETISSAAA